MTSQRQLLWGVQILVQRPMAAFPRLNYIGSERRVDVSYHHEGRLRQRETQCVFQYTLSGEGVFADASGEHRLPAETGFLCEIRDPRTSYHYPEGAAEPWVFLYASFGGQGVREMVGEMVERWGAVYRIDRREGAIQRLLAMQSLSGRECAMTSGECAHAVVELLSALAATRERAVERDPENALVRRALERIRSDLGGDLNATALARRVGCSREHLTRVFRTQVGVTPHKYIAMERIKAALGLLRGSEMSVKEIAASLGFSHQAQFTRLFKASTGTLPSAYRAGRE